VSYPAHARKIPAALRDYRRPRVLFDFSGGLRGVAGVWQGSRIY
jgi:hypothetical protein